MIMVCNLVTWIGYSKFQNWSKLTGAPLHWTYNIASNELTIA